MILLLHVKQQKTKLSKNCHPHNTRIGSGYISYERLFEWWEEQNRWTYIYICKNSKTTGTYVVLPVNVAAGHRSSPGLRLGLTPLLVLIERVSWISLLSSLLLLLIYYMTKHISHTCGRSCRPARYLPSSTHSHTSKRCLATALRVSSSITTGHYVLNKDVDPKRLGSENNTMKETQQAHT